MSTVLSNRRPLKPAPVACRVLVPVGQVAAATGLVEIDGKSYLLACLCGGYRLFPMERREGHPNCYDVSAAAQCDCADATFRPEREGGCKHARALRILVANHELPQAHAAA